MKTFKILYSFFIVVMLLLLYSCSTGSNKASNETEIVDSLSNNRLENTKQTNVKDNTNLNLSIFLDLSDRISPKKNPMPGMAIYQRDLGYIKSISDSFESHLKSSKIIRVNDQMQVFFEPEPMNTTINSLASKMKLSFDKNNISKDAIAKIAPVYLSSSSKIYNLALKDQHFVGADIWSFFKNKVKDYCIKTKHRNILVILTDGYMYHQDNKIKEGNQTTYITPELISAAKLNGSNYQKLIEEKKFGFIPATENLQDLEVLVLGINPLKGKNFEEDVIKKYWVDWFKAMGVKRYYLKDADLPSNLDTVIKEFILN
jgi:hypothetical protein